MKEAPAFTLRILGHNVCVSLVTSPMGSTDVIGEADYQGGQIRILANLEQSVFQATLLHETIHIIDHHLGLQLSEEQVAGIAQGLFQVFRDNPRFLKGE